MKTYYLINKSTTPFSLMYQGDGTLQYQRKAHSFEQANSALPEDRAYVPMAERPPWDADTQRVDVSDEVTATERLWKVVDLPQSVIEAKAEAKKVQSVTRRELMLALALVGLSEDVLSAQLGSAIATAQAAFDAADPANNLAETIALTKAKMSLIEFETSSEFDRNHPLVAATAASLGLDVDTVFDQAIKFKDVGYDPFAPESDPEEEVV